MLEVVIPGIRYGEGKINSSTARNGSHCYIAGFDDDGYQLLQLPYTTAAAARAIYPIKKYYFEEDLSDTSDAVDKLTKGDNIIYYEGGEYITDQFDQYTIGLDDTYWANVELTASSTVGNEMYPNPGSSTAVGTFGVTKLYVGTVEPTVNKVNILYGDTSFSVGTIPDDQYVGFLIGVYYSDSSDAKIRYRISPANIHNTESIG